MILNEEILGVIYPISEKIFKSIEQGRRVFLKFPVHERNKKSKTNLHAGIKIYFYISNMRINSKYPIKGEAIIKKLEFCSLDFLKEKYIKQLPITLDELEDYAKGRETKLIMVFHLGNFKKYEPTIFIKKPITMNGLYVTGSRKKEIGLSI